MRTITDISFKSSDDKNTWPSLELLERVYLIVSKPPFDIRNLMYDLLSMPVSNETMQPMLVSNETIHELLMARITKEMNVLKAKVEGKLRENNTASSPNIKHSTLWDKEIQMMTYSIVELEVYQAQFKAEKINNEIPKSRELKAYKEQVLNNISNLWKGSMQVGNIKTFLSRLKGKYNNANKKLKLAQQPKS